MPASEGIGTTPAPAPAPTPAPAPAKAQVFTGVGTENIGTIKVPTDSVLHWSCGSCGSDNFQIFNDYNDLNSISVNGLDQTGGKTVISAGSYHKVLINTEGQNWTLKITPGT